MLHTLSTFRSLELVHCVLAKRKMKNVPFDIILRRSVARRANVCVLLVGKSLLYASYYYMLCTFSVHVQL